VKKNKRFETQRIARWKLLDRLAWLIPLLALLYLAFVNGNFIEYFTGALDAHNLSALLFITLFFVLYAAFLSAPLVIIWRAITHYLRKNALKNASYHAVEGIDYYREKLTGLSPVMISLLVDLEIETKKDVSALILTYVMKGVVSFSGNLVTVSNREHPDLKKSDFILLDELERGGFTQDGLALWKDLALQEARSEGESTGLLKHYKDQKNTAPKGCFLGCLGSILLLLSTVIVTTVVLDFDKIDAYLAAIPTENLTLYEQIEYLIVDPVMATQLLVLLVAGVLLFAAFILPLAVLIKTIVVSKKFLTSVERTDQGFIVTEQIAGMKNFIRDFSNLSQAEKEALIVWDDFLIYAVVLEENETITKEIFGMSKLSYDSFRSVRL
jgi:hypothetical protein